MNFRIEIEIGNDAMRTGADVATTLRALADRLEDYQTTIPTDHAWPLRDANGNRVGTATAEPRARRSKR